MYFYAFINCIFSSLHLNSISTINAAREAAILKGEWRMKGYLLLQDGTFFEGKLIGDLSHSVGEVVFNTGMTGYQEILTDPSYYKQIVVMSYPLMGNYGVNATDFQSEKSYVSGFIVSHLNEDYSNPHAVLSLEHYLKEQGVSCLTGVDTRALIKKIRTGGALLGKIITNIDDAHWHVEDLKNTLFYAIANDVSTKKITRVSEGYPEVALIDFGVKEGIVQSLVNKGCGVTLFPSRTLPQEIEAYKPDCLLLSNGPGNPQDMQEGIYNARYFAGKIPLFGICLGHQIIALAQGAKTEKMPFGHRGTNHPVKDLLNKSISITSQNHGYHIVPESLPAHLIKSHTNLNDQTIEGIKHTTLPVYSVQYHPEAYPGPSESSYFFDELIAMTATFVEVNSCKKCS
jgi:carbamoyl-phosphate synthase small subunit